MNRIRSLSNTYLVMLLVILAIALFGGEIVTEAAQSDSWASNQSISEAPNIISEDSAYIIFSEEPVKKGMSYIAPENAGRYDEFYSEQVEFGGIPCRQVYKENKFYLKMDENFANAEDRIFSISFDYWNYGGGGNIYLDYYPAGSDEISTLTILKLGLDENNNKTAGCWYRVTVCVEDGHIGRGKMPDGADFRIRSGAYNAFSKFEVKNLSVNAGNDFLGVYNSPGYEMLQQLGYFPQYDANVSQSEFYSKNLTREEAIVLMIKGYGMEKDALSKNLATSFTDVSKENVPYVAFAETMGVISGGGILNREEPFTQKELVQMYLNLLSINVPEGGDIYATAREKGLITSGSLIFQPDRAADMDAFAGLCTGALFITNEITGFNAFSDGINRGNYNLGEFMKTGIAPVIGWVKKNSFKLPKNTYYDEFSGRTYYSLDFFGSHAAKSYYTQNCMASDQNRFYFKAMEKYIMEYNIETGMCRYIDEYHGSGCLVTPLDNLWYVDSSLKIAKVDLDTYEKEVVAALPEWQSNAWSLHINNDETWANVWFVTDGSGEVDNKTESRMPRLNLKTGEWDLRYKYGFQNGVGQLNPNHMYINPNPLYSNLYIFAHDGSNKILQTGNNHYIPDRTWMLNFDTGEFVNAIKQKWLVSPNKETAQTGRVGESGGHESWSWDGEWLFNVSLSWFPSNILYNIHDYDGMIVMVRSTDLKDKRIIPADYDVTRSEISLGAGINHAQISFDNRWFVGDCQYAGRRADLYIFDSETGETHLLAKTVQNGVDPGHTHPQMSPSGKYVLFGQWSNDMTHAEIAWMDISDITDNPSPGGRVQVSEFCEVLSYDCDEEHSIKTYFDANGDFEYATVPRDHYMYVDVDKELVESDNTSATISFTYKDDSKLPIKFVYYTWHENAATRDRNVFKTHEIYIQRTGTGKEITKTYKFDDICLGNMQVLGTDFKIGAVGTEATILSVEVSTDN